MSCERPSKAVFYSAAVRSITDYVAGWRRAADDWGVDDGVIDQTLASLAESVPEPDLDAFSLALAEAMTQARGEAWLMDEKSGYRDEQIKLARLVLHKLQERGIGLRQSP